MTALQCFSIPFLWRSSHHSSPRGPVQLVSKHTLTHRSYYLRDYLNTTGNAVFFSLQEDGFQSQNESCLNQRDIFFLKAKVIKEECSVMNIRFFSKPRLSARSYCIPALGFNTAAFKKLPLWLWAIHRPQLFAPRWGLMGRGTILIRFQCICGA